MMYSIHYTEWGIIQRKRLVSHEKFLQMKAAEKLILSLLQKNGAKFVSDELIEAENTVKTIKKEFGDNWFTDGSPLWEANATGVLVTPYCQNKMPTQQN